MFIKLCFISLICDQYFIYLYVLLKGLHIVRPVYDIEMKYLWGLIIYAQANLSYHISPTIYCLYFQDGGRLVLHRICEHLPLSKTCFFFSIWVSIIECTDMKTPYTSFSFDSILEIHCYKIYVYKIFLENLYSSGYTRLKKPFPWKIKSEIDF